LKDLEKQPSLLARTAATAVKKFLSDHEENHENAKEALFEACQNCLKKS
jgi:ParB family chromosome partitioning protein